MIPGVEETIRELYASGLRGEELIAEAVRRGIPEAIARPALLVVISGQGDVTGQTY